LILELGKGFAFVGSQYRLDVGGQAGALFCVVASGESCIRISGILQRDLLFGSSDSYPLPRLKQVPILTDVRCIITGSEPLMDRQNGDLGPLPQLWIVSAWCSSTDLPVRVISDGSHIQS
jgi:hypothetical protein